MGAIGVTVNGVQIFNNADALRRDAYLNEGDTFDACGGHASPGGAYHFHTGAWRPEAGLGGAEGAVCGGQVPPASTQGRPCVLHALFLSETTPWSGPPSLMPSCL